MRYVRCFRRHKALIRCSLTLIAERRIPSEVAPLILFKLFNDHARYTRRSLQLR